MFPAGTTNSEQAMRQSRARGCLLGQLAGDALGGLVEFQTPERIRGAYPRGVRELAGGGTWHTIAGQPTDDSELALLLARMLVERGGYDPGEARKQDCSGRLHVFQKSQECYL